MDLAIEWGCSSSRSSRQILEELRVAVTKLPPRMPGSGLPAGYGLAQDPQLLRDVSLGRAGLAANDDADRRSSQIAAAERVHEGHG